VAEVGKVNVGKVVAGLVIVGAESVAGDRLGYDAATSKADIVRPLKEVLPRTRVSDERRSVAGESWAEIGALPSGEPELIGVDGMVGLADHLKLKIGDNGGERKRRMFEEILVALAAGFLTAEADEEDGAARALGKRAEGAGQLEDGGGAAGIVIGAVKDGFAAGAGERGADAEMIEVGAEQDGLLGQFGIGATENREGVVGGGRVVYRPGVERDELNLSGFQTERLELGGDVGGGDEFVVGGAAASA